MGDQSHARKTENTLILDIKTVSLHPNYDLKTGTCGILDSTLFDNSNGRGFVGRPSIVGMFDLYYVQLIRPKNLVKQNII